MTVEFLFLNYLNLVMAWLTFISKRYYFVLELWLSQVLFFIIVIIWLEHIVYIFRLVDKMFSKFLCYAGACKAYSWGIDILFVHPWGELILVTCNTWHSWATCKISYLYLLFCLWWNPYLCSFSNLSGYKAFKLYMNKV